MLFEWCLFLLECAIIYHVFCTVCAVAWALILYRIIPILWKPNFEEYKHRWAVINGCTDGIGKRYTIELANYGFRKFILIGRNEKKLEDVSSLLAQYEGIETKHCVFDYLTNDYEPLKQICLAHDVGFLVNSIGMAPKLLRNFSDQVESNREIMKVNVDGTMETLHAVLPSMVKHGGGQIVVISSVQGYGPVPTITSYCASKAAVAFITEAVGREYSYANIKAQCLMPCMVATKMAQYDHKADGLFVVTPDTMVTESVRTVGLSKECAGCFKHEILSVYRYLLPWCLLKYFLVPIYVIQRRRLDRLEKERQLKESPSEDDFEQVSH